MTCASCGSPMAADQRYCLTCGARGADARLPFLDALKPGEATLVPYGAPMPRGAGFLPAGPPTLGDRLRANAGVLAGVAVLLLTLVVGVLIGAGLGGDAPQAAAAPATQVIRLEGGAAAPVAATPTTPDPAEDASASDDASSGSSSKDSSSSKATSSSKEPTRATNSAVKNLDKLTGAAAVKAADKLGKKIAVGGKPPKKDNKPAAGGGSFEEIG